MKVVRIKRNRYLISEIQCCGKVEVVTEIIIDTGEGSLGGFFILWYDTHRIIFSPLILNDGFRVNPGEVVIIIRLLGDFRACRVSREVIGAGLLYKSGVCTTTIPLRPTIVILPYLQRKYRLRDWIQLNIVDAHPISPAVFIVVDAFKRDDVIKAGTDFGIDALQRERKRREIGVQIFRVNDNLIALISQRVDKLHEHVIEINLDAVLRVWCIVVEVIRIKSDQQLIGGFQACGQVEMVTEIIIDTGESTLSSLLVDQHGADRLIIAVVFNHLRVFTSKIVIIIRLPISLGARGVSWKIIGAGLLNKGGVCTTTVADGPTVIVLPD